MDQRLREAGFDPENPLILRVLALTEALHGHPRHLSQHVGGFVISDTPLWNLVPVENAAMADRTIIQWDKDDLDVLGLLKVDVLALGMLTCVRKTLDLLRSHRDRDLTPATIPAEDPTTYAMIQRGDVVGVFQIESRAQMAMLPRLKPGCFYDLVIEVAIVRPGPIQGGMVHPYLRRRQGLDPVDYPSEELRPVFERTLGIPLFQEQVMQLAITAAEYTPGEADQLRRAMAAWKRHGGMGPHHERLVTRMVERGYTTEYAERIFEQIKGFGSYGFPESHAASFALITYVSCWLKCHEPAAFSCALLNSLPMGFYQPPQLVADARRHDIDVRPVDVRYSDWDCTLEPWPGDAARQPALRLGMRLVHGLREEAAVRISAARAQAPFRDLDDLAFRAELERATLDQLAEAAALRGLAGHRHRARWSTAGTERQLPLFAGAQGVAESRTAIPPPSTIENTRADYASTGLSLGTHPVALIRRQLSQRRYRRSTELAALPNGRPARFAGIVILRQRPQTASGVTFLTLEDEAGMVNVVVWQQVAERQRRVFLESQLLAVEGRMESADGSQHLIATRLENLSPLLAGLNTNSRDFR
jgi:error-prone DNA polymerase